MDLHFKRLRPDSGPTIVLLHSLALDGSVWDGVAKLLVGTHDLLIPDLPGHGGSPTLPAETTIESMADDVAGLIDAEGIQSAVVVGLSLGGCVAQALAVRHPQLVSGLGLIDTTCWYGEGALEKWESRAKRASEAGLGSLADFQLARWFTPRFREQNAEVCAELLNVFRSTDLDSYVASCRAMGRLDLRDEVAQINVPTLIMVGADDPATPVPHSKDLHERIKASKLEIIANCSHMSAVERPDEITRLLVSTLLSPAEH